MVSFKRQHLRSVRFQVGSDVNAVLVGARVCWCISFAPMCIRSAGLGLRSRFDRAFSKMCVEVTANLESYKL